MSRWFRLYDELLDDPKVQLLPADDFRGYINLLCLASRSAGRLPEIGDVAYALRRPLNDIETLVSRLKNGGLIVTKNGGTNGSHNAINGWDKRQFKSDASTERVKRFRERRGTREETPPESETESETERARGRAPDSSAGKKATKPKARFEFAGEETIMRGVREELCERMDPGHYATMFCNPERAITFVSEEGRLIAYCAAGFTHSLVRDQEFRLSKIAQNHGFKEAWIREQPQGDQP